MSKSKLALLIFCGAVGINIIAFVFGHKAWLIEENKTIWLYELPASASPLDSGVATDIGPSQAIQGTLIRPGSADHGTEIAGELAKDWAWDSYNHSLTFHLNPEIKFQDGSNITAQQMVDSAKFIQEKLTPYKSILSSAEWLAWLTSNYKAINDQTLEIKFSTATTSKNVDILLRDVFTQSLTGIIHPTNLLDLKAGKKVDSSWISSGPYLVRKWRAKEVILVSRVDYPIGLDHRFFRVIKYQSAPVINPAAHFLQALEAEPEVSDEHSKQAKDSELHIFWICRSWKDAGSFCADEPARTTLAKIISGEKNLSLAGKTVRYRIPAGTEAFREKIAKQIQEKVTLAGGAAKEVSYLFKNSNDADIELEFIVTKKGAGSGYAELLARISGRLGEAGMQPNLLGKIDVFPLNIQFKGSMVDGPYEAFKRAFTEPDLGDKRLELKK